MWQRARSWLALTFVAAIVPSGACTSSGKGDSSDGSSSGASDAAEMDASTLDVTVDHAAMDASTLDVIVHDSASDAPSQEEAAIVDAAIDIPPPVDPPRLRRFAAGGGLACSIAVDETVRCARAGQVWIPVDGVSSAVEVAMNNEGTACALRRDGAVWCWHLTDSVPQPKLVSIPLASQISVGIGLGCSLGRDQSVHCWAVPKSGVSNPDPTPQSIAVPQARSMAAGIDGACAVTLSGELWCWGTFVPPFVPPWVDADAGGLDGGSYEGGIRSLALQKPPARLPFPHAIDRIFMSTLSFYRVWQMCAWKAMTDDVYCWPYGGSERMAPFWRTAQQVALIDDFNIFPHQRFLVLDPAGRLLDALDESPYCLRDADGGCTPSTDIVDVAAGQGVLCLERADAEVECYEHD